MSQNLQGRWKELFGAQFEIVLDDLIRTYFESDPPFPEGDKRRFGYSRDRLGNHARRISLGL